MHRSHALWIAVMLVTVPLVGCIGSDDPADDLTEQSTPDAAKRVPAMVYRAGSQGLEADPVGDAEAALPDGVPLPSGLDRSIGAPIFEPTIGVTSDGALFVSNLEGPRVTDYSSIVRSTDQGQTWEDVTGSIGPVSSPPQSNDPYVYVDQATDRVYNLDMQGLACNYIRWSDDGGETWTANPLGCGQPPLLDHPTIFAGPPRELPTAGYENIVYLCVNRVADSACATSLDGGLTWAGFKTVFPGEDPEHAEVNTSDPLDSDPGFCGGLHAHGTTGPDGRAYLPKGQCGTPMVAISEDDGLTWETVTITEDVPVAGHEVAFAVDEAGNAYAFWISEDEKPYLAVSTDGGFTWEDPMQVAPPGVTITDFPTITAGADGRIAVAYIGTHADVPREDMDERDHWDAYLTTTVNATAEDPVFTTVQVNPEDDPIARGSCSGRCTPPEGGGALGDFIDVTIDEDGRPWAVFVDACTEACAQPDGTENDVGVGFVGTLDQGPTLRGPLGPLDPLTATP